MRIGIDIGNVIIGADTDDPDVFFGENYLAAPLWWSLKIGLVPFALSTIPAYDFFRLTVIRLASSLLRKF